MTGRSARIAATAIAFAAATLYATLAGRDSDDTLLWFVPWMNRIIELGPVASLASDFANYTPPFMTLLAAVSLLHPWLSPLLLVKLVCVLGTLLCAAAMTGLLRCLVSPDRALLGGAAFLLLPTVALNGAAWGQSDGYYGAAVLWSVAAAIRGRWLVMMAAFGVALAFKLQAVLVGPFLLYVVIAQRIPLRYGLVPPLVAGTLMLPAWAAGRPAGEIASIYLQQAELFRWLAMNAPNPWSFVQRTGLISYEAGVAIGFALAAAAGIGVASLAVRRRLEGPDLLLVALLSALAMPFLLPKMHDRYFFLADALSYGLAVAAPGAGTIAILALVQAGSLGAYAAYLAGWKLGTYLGAFAMAVGLALVLARTARLLAPARASLASEGAAAVAGPSPG